MLFSLATWNINSVRLRMPLVERFLDEHQPDILCLQETKCPNELFPVAPFNDRGYLHQAIHGQKGYHGVAILSRLALRDMVCRDPGDVGHARHVSALFDVAGRTVRLHNFYVPAGGDEPDPAVNPKFAHKLDFVERLKAVHAGAEPGVSALLVGDLNIAPLEHDVWSHRQMLKIVSHTQVETEGLRAAIAEGGWLDLMRKHVPEPEKLYTWWSYRSANWQLADKGRRLDHVWSSPDLGIFLHGVEILKAARAWERPSDHVPVIARFAF